MTLHMPRLGGVVLASVAACVVAVSIGRADAESEITGQVTGNRRYLRDAVAYIENVPGRHTAPRRPVELDQRNHRFIPRVLPVVRGTVVRFLNNDNENHNVFSPDNGGYDLGNWPGGEYREHRFDRLGVYTQLCRLHPSMIGYILVLQNPYFARVQRDGSFRIAGVPPGTYTVKVWQERGEGFARVTVRRGQSAEVQVEMGRRRR